MLLALLAPALACDVALFSVIPLPAIPAGAEMGFGSARSTFRGVPLVGGRVAMVSRHSIPAWRKVLDDPGRQDDWQGTALGNALTELIDSSHLYMRVDLSLLWGAYHIRKQVVAEFHDYVKGDGLRSCWQVVDPTPWRAAVAAWDDGNPWESDTYGCWDLAPRPDGTTLVSYQWWTAASAIPGPAQDFVLSHTLPDMVHAFEAEVTRVAGG